MDKNFLDAPSEGAIVDKNPTATKALNKNMSPNSQQFTTRYNYVGLTKRVHEIQVFSSKKIPRTQN